MYSKTDQLIGFDLTYGANPAIPYVFTYSANNLVEKVSAAGKNTSFKYDEGGKPKIQTNGNGTQDQFDYNEGQQLTGTSTVNSTGTKLLSSQYSYDDDGRLITVTGNGPGSPAADYFYNDINGTEKLNRLTQATITDGGTPYTFNYSYDPAGNIQSMNVPSGQTNTFAYDGDNKISTINGSASNVSYDANGNFTKLTVNGKTQQYVYDAANRLTALKDGAGAVIASYTYDGDGQRLTKTANGETIAYHYFSGQLVYETSSEYSGKVTARYTRSPEGKLLSVNIYGAAGNNDYYYHYNAQGDVVAVTDSTGAVKDGGPNGGNTVDINNDQGFNNAYTYRGYR
ncbi:RHS repeat protein [Desulfosporosinus sp. OT]|uniref:RHS repeat protein n=1 Tax=Desulfosporosinus sp. OT TaxID=913865 RepID=UPI0002239CDE|nr:RHS repeat protein [Desulfosporosinus sp. OT]EGW39337.1 RHS Repeat family protein [Desulfosporosinus sp. OT]